MPLPLPTGPCWLWQKCLRCANITAASGRSQRGSPQGPGTSLSTHLWGCASHSCPALGWSARLDAVSLRRRTTFKQTKTNYLNYESGICWEIRVSCLFICCDCCLLQTKEVRRAPSLLHAQCVTAVHYFTFCKECFDGLESHIQTTARKGEARCRAFSSSNS